MRAGGGETLCQILSRGGSGGAHARWGLRAGVLRRGRGRGPGMGRGPAPSRGFRGRPALHCRPACSTPQPRLPCSPLAMCGCPRPRGEGPTHGVQLPAAAPAACWGRCHPPAPCAGGLAWCVTVPADSGGPRDTPGSGDVVGRVAMSPGWARLPGEFGDCAGSGGSRVSLSQVDLVAFLGALWSVSAEGNAPRTPGTGCFVA